MVILHLRLYGHVARCSWTGVCVFERQKGMWTGCTEPPEFRVRMRSCSPRLEQHGGANSSVSLPARRRELVYLLCFLARVIGPSSQGTRAKFGLLDKSIPASKQLVRLGRYQPIGALVSMRILGGRPTEVGPIQSGICRSGWATAWGIRRLSHVSTASLRSRRILEED